MPAPARILAEIQGKDAEDTGERQMGAFRALVQMIDDMAWGLGHRYVDDADTRAATPDEARLRLAYETAYAEVRKTVANKDGHVYDRDRNLYNELLHKFFSQEFRAQYFRANRNAQADYNAFMDKLSAKPASAESQQGAASDARPGMRYDAGSVAVRHCMESGRSEIECLGKGFQASLTELNGGHGLTEGLVRKTPAGLRLTGIYSTEHFALSFGQDSVTVSCGTLIPQSRLYTVERRAWRNGTTPGQIAKRRYRETPVRALNDK